MPLLCVSVRALPEKQNQETGGEIERERKSTCVCVRVCKETLIDFKELVYVVVGLAGQLRWKCSGRRGCLSP